MLSVLLLVIESIIFVLYFHTPSRILWFSVLPCTYYFFMLLKNINITIPYKISLLFRKMSTLIYVEHGLFLILFRELETWKYFIAVLIASSVLALGIVKISEIKYFRWVKHFY